MAIVSANINILKWAYIRWMAFSLHDSLHISQLATAKKKGRKKGLRSLFQVNYTQSMHNTDLCRSHEDFCFLTLFICLYQLEELFYSHFSLLCGRTVDCMEHGSATKIGGRVTGICHLTFKLIVSCPYFISLSLQPLSLSFQYTLAKWVENRCNTRNALNNPSVLDF